MNPRSRHQAAHETIAFDNDGISNDGLHQQDHGEHELGDCADSGDEVILDRLY